MPGSPDPSQPAEQPFRVARLDEIERVRATEFGWWRPIRRHLGVTGFGVNAYTADRAGDAVIEPHDETSPGAGAHQELYLVLSGGARFTVADQVVDSPAGTMLLIEPGVHRAAEAAAPDTTVLVIGGRPGAALPTSPFEHWFAAQPAYEEGDYGRAAEIASQGLRDWPRHPTLHYQLACFKALGGRRAEALEHLRVAFDGDPRTRDWAADDSDLDSIRDDPGFPQ
jgi:mannose-6-phosphate isomerase-like protein (cupin superfamily)